MQRWAATSRPAKTVDVQSLIGKTADRDFLREMIGFAAQRLMEMEVGGLFGLDSPISATSPARTGYGLASLSRDR
jgi:hypothetical protein